MHAAAIHGDGIGPTASLVRRCALEDVFLILTGRTFEDSAATGDPLRALHVIKWNARSFRALWRSAFSRSLLNPVLFLAAMGLLLGKLVDEHSGPRRADLSRVRRPGMLVALAMQIGANEGSLPVLAGISWAKTYHAVVATPEQVRELFSGLLSWVAARIFAAATLFACVAAVAGAFLSPRAVLTPFAACSAGCLRSSDGGIVGWSREPRGPDGRLPVRRAADLSVLGDVLPDRAAAGLAAAHRVGAPLWHGVKLCRDVTDRACRGLPTLGHVMYLVASTLVSSVVAVRLISRKLLS